ncbi:hypothetical protein [Azospirillum canadense]|uniref:hypothetical protein n=1 Tax=Azospirillum canadense TaxID=403962 RepID=UPI002226998B|nr:hypothetical protein [Azospirillum canadense]MCW2239756.1 hypothetical protein [Azospirillum canadense]
MPANRRQPNQDSAFPFVAETSDGDPAPDGDDHPVADTLIRNMAATIAVFLALSVLIDTLLDRFGG